MKTNKDKLKARDLNTLTLWNKGFLAIGDELNKLQIENYNYFGIMDALDYILSFMNIDNNIVNVPLISKWLSGEDYEKMKRKNKNDLII
jgi:hypothetical protein